MNMWVNVCVCGCECVGVCGLCVWCVLCCAYRMASVSIPCICRLLAMETGLFESVSAEEDLERQLLSKER